MLLVDQRNKRIGARRRTIKRMAYIILKVYRKERRSELIGQYFSLISRKCICTTCCFVCVFSNLLVGVGSTGKVNTKNVQLNSTKLKMNYEKND